MCLGLARGVGQEESAYAQETATSAATAPVADTLAAHGGPSDTVERVDVVMWGSTTSGLGALRGLKMAAPGLDGPIRVALLSNTSVVESPLVQGLCLEDDYHPETVGGFYAEFRREVLARYAAQGVWPLEAGGRLTYEPEVAAQVLQELAFSEGLVPQAARDKVDVIRMWGGAVRRPGRR